jgi:hypothetical protein
MKVTHNQCALWRSTTTLQAQDRHVPSNTFKKGIDHYCSDQMVLGFPPAHKGKWTKGSHDALQEGIVPPAGDTASLSGEPIRIPPEKTLSTTPEQFVTAEPGEDMSSPPTNMRHTVTKPPSSSHHG